VGCWVDLEMVRYISLLLFIGLAFGSDSERIISKWDNGVTKRIQYYRGSGFDEELIGVKTFYPNGDLRWKCRYQNNKRHGEYLFYLEGNKLLLEGTYTNGDIDYDGKWYAYHPEKIKGNGVIFWNDKYTIEVNFHDNGELEGYRPSIEDDYTDFIFLDYNNYNWYKNGILERTAYNIKMKDDEHTWPLKIEQYYENGNPKIIWKSKRDFKDIESTHYYPNGIVKSTEVFGVKTFYKPDGSIDFISD
jgi:antitoxin component YwqK of YwqJK toxin-antitoxin module